MSNTPQIRFAGFTDAWEQRKVGDVLSESRDAGHSGDIAKKLTVKLWGKGVYAKNDKGSAATQYFTRHAGQFIYSKLDFLNSAFGVVPQELESYESTADLPAFDCIAVDPYFMFYRAIQPSFYLTNGMIADGSRKAKRIHVETFLDMPLDLPSIEEQKKVASYFTQLDSLITLHQREPPKEDKILNDIKTDTLFHEYYCQWLVIYKEGSVRGVTMQKYHLTAEWVKKLIPDVKLCDFDRITYQQLINDYAETHERQTTMDFHHQLKGAILDAVDDGLIARDPTRKVIIKGKSPNDKKKKYLSRYELQKLLTSLDLNSGLNMDWLILLIAKTGMRFSEAIAVTPMDFDFTHQTLSVNKTWDYKGEGGFQPTKNKSSVRKIRLDWQTVGQFYAIVRELNDTAPIFVSKEKKIYNSTLNDVLERHCKAVGIPTISVHGLRHTHASLLLFDGVSIASVAQRLGHSSINTTQKTYLHIIRELENKDIDLIMKSISSLLD